jgi:hypothetical protein
MDTTSRALDIRHGLLLSSKNMLEKELINNIRTLLIQGESVIQMSLFQANLSFIGLIPYSAYGHNIPYLLVFVKTPLTLFRKPVR